MKKFFFLFAILYYKHCTYGELEPRRPIDLWNPFGTSTTRRSGLDQRKNEIIVRLSVGDLVGKKNLIPNLPWSLTEDLNENLIKKNSDFNAKLNLTNNIMIYSFLGVPYAEPPISQRRFKPPQQLIHFPGKNPFVAFQYAPSCPQDIESRPTLLINEPYHYHISEDCLYLNIFTPEASKSSNTIYPVMVFFHGGNFQTGSASDWPGYILASRGIVVVTVNYRLGPFGFMSLGDQNTGNYGIKDQRMALTWVQQHIASFGGDPQAVTIVGHDAGAVSAGIHMLSSYSKNLFRAVVSMSGAETSYHSIIGKPILAFNNTMKLGQYLGCVQPVAQRVWDCILTRSTNDIVQALSTKTLPSIPIEYNRYLFMPTVDGHELMSHPLWILNNIINNKAKIYTTVPYLIGLNQHDGVEAILEDRTLGEFTNFLQIKHTYMHSFIVEYVFRHNYTMNKEAIIEAIESYYTFWPDPADVWKIREKFIELITDAYYTAPIMQSANLHSITGSRTFVYVNNYNFSHHKLNIDNNNYNFFPDWIGSCHECDLYLLFGFPLMPEKFLPKLFRKIKWDKQDQKASQLFSMFFKQFIKYTDPNFPQDVTWKPYQPREHWYLAFNYTLDKSFKFPGILCRDYRYKEVAFWNNYLPSLVNYMTTTFPPEEVTVRRSLVTFEIISGVLTFVIMILLVICLSMGYSICTKYAKNEEIDRSCLMNESISKSFETSANEIYMQRISSF